MQENSISNRDPKRQLRRAAVAILAFGMVSSVIAGVAIFMLQQICQKRMLLGAVCRPTPNSVWFISIVAVGCIAIGAALLTSAKRR